MKEIRQILNVYDNANLDTEKMALASVVNIEESSYRRIGARMLVSSNGNWIGGISGGCLEGDALRRAQEAIFNKQSSIVTYDTLEDDANQIGVGLGCNGKIDVLFTPIEPSNKNNEIEQLRKVVESKRDAIMIKVIGDSENNEHLGQSLLVESKLEELSFCNCDMARLSSTIKETRIHRRPQVIEHINIYKQPVSLLVEYIKPETKLIVVGDNYDVISMMGVAKELGWETHVVCRKKKLSKSIFNAASEVYEYEDAHQAPIDDYTAVVLMTHDFNWDKKLLQLFLSKKPAYVGMLGPAKRTVKMQNELNISELNKIDFFHSPVGLDIGAESPEEIAISIAAEIIATFRDRKGAPLKFRSQTIHSRL